MADFYINKIDGLNRELCRTQAEYNSAMMRVREYEGRKMHLLCMTVISPHRRSMSETLVERQI